jgi:hypothetical protein
MTFGLSRRFAQLVSRPRADGARMARGRRADGARTARGWRADGARTARGWRADVLLPYHTLASAEAAIVYG